jgi:hypothetical protein
MIDSNFWGVLYFMLSIGAVFMLGSMALFVASIGLYQAAKNRDSETDHRPDFEIETRQGRKQA